MDNSAEHLWVMRGVFCLFSAAWAHRIDADHALCEIPARIKTYHTIISQYIKQGYTVMMNDDMHKRLQKTLAACDDRQDLYTTIVNAPFAFKIETTHLALGIIVLLFADKMDGLIHRVALSQTEMAAGTQDVSVKRFEDIKIPLDYEQNSIAAAIRTQKPQTTADWAYLFAPDLAPDEARLNQAGGGIACSIVYPLPGVGDGAALIFSYYQYLDRIGQAQNSFMERYSALVAKTLRARS